MDSLPKENALPKGLRECTILCMIGMGIYIMMPFTILVYMVRDFGVSDPAEVGKLTGYLGGVTHLGALLSSYPWGLLSDKVGRRPVLIIGNTFCALTILIFGMSGSYLMAMAARFSGGALNGVAGALKTTIGEASDETNQARAMSYLSAGWGLGGVLGPAIGGLLSNVCTNSVSLGSITSVCPAGGLLRTYPYFLPCLMCALMNFTAAFVAFLYIPETLPSLKKSPSLVESCPSAAECLTSEANSHSGDGFALDPPELRHAAKRTAEVKSPLPWSQSGAALNSYFVNLIKHGSPRSSPRTREALDSPTYVQLPSRSLGQHEDEDEDEDGESFLDGNSEGEGLLSQPSDQLRWWQDRQCVLLIIGYGLLAFTYMMVNESIPIYAAASRVNGGLNMSSSTLGVPLSFGGAALLTYTLFFFPLVSRHLGLRRTCQAGACFSMLPILGIPFIAFVPEKFGIVQSTLLGICCGLNSIGASSAFTSSLVLLNMSAPTGQMGAVNGVGQAVSSLVRGIGPAVGGYLWAFSLHMDVPGHQATVFVVAALSLISVLCLYETIKLGRKASLLEVAQLHDVEVDMNESNKDSEDISSISNVAEDVITDMNSNTHSNSRSVLS